MSKSVDQKTKAHYWHNAGNGLFAFVYEDDGANGPCGQAGSVTNKRIKLCLFESQDEMRKAIWEIEDIKNRLNPRVTDIFYPDEINFVLGGHHDSGGN